MEAGKLRLVALQKSTVEMEQRDLASEPEPAKIEIPPIKTSRKPKASAPQRKTIANHFVIEDVHAVAKPGAKEKGLPVGYALARGSPTSPGLEAFSKTSLVVVSDKSFLVKKVVTGAIVIKLKPTVDPKAFRLPPGASTTYSAPQIRTLIAQIDDGENLPRFLEQVRASPEVESAELEMLGAGAKPL